MPSEVKGAIMAAKRTTARDRRWIIGAVLAGAMALAAGLPVALGRPIDRGRPLGDREAAIHVANRLGYGGDAAFIAEVSRRGWRAWVEAQLKPESIDDLALDERLNQDFPSVRMSPEQIRDAYQSTRPADNSPAAQKAANQERNRLRNQLKQELQGSVVVRAVYSKRQFNEVMVNFWRNHLSVDVNKVPFLATHYEEAVLRKHAFGKFEDLLMASAKHPAMLVFLDNYVSTVRKPNENYARELMELHTLGVDNHYKQKDVVELARVLTGWTCNGRRSGPGFQFHGPSHDAKPATVLGLRLDGKGGVADGEAAIRYLAHHEGTARFIATKLCKYLVSDQPSTDLIDRIAKVFTETGGDLPAVYRAIIFSPEFLDSGTARAKFKTPFEFTVSTLRTTDAKVESPRELLRELNLMGQPIYECDVPTGFADQAEAWLDPGIMVYRWNFAIRLLTGKIKGVTLPEATLAKYQAQAPYERARKVMDAYLPGVSDPPLQQKIARVGDARAMIAFALGSANFQQQ